MVNGGMNDLGARDFAFQDLPKVILMSHMGSVNFKGMQMIKILTAMAIGFAVFGFFPQIDVTVSSWFYHGEWVGRQGILWIIRNVYYKISYIVPVVFLVLYGVACVRKTQVPRRVYGFFTALYLLGPLLIVNGVLKAHWGRARPRDVLEFGGDKLFTPAQIWPTDQCLRDCSFVSGEGSACFAMLIILVVMLGGSRKREAIYAAMILPMGFLRIVAGGHFLSDVLFSGLVVGFIYVALLRVMKLEASDLRTSWRAVWSDVKGLVGR